jgi:Na+-transporting NADH:ubiquinone oxidoreductase subunit B/electron transport complex protein RnfD
MKQFLSFLQRLRPHFEEGGKLSALKPLFGAAENFFFGPDTQTKQFPHVRDPLDVKRYMSMVIIGLLPATMASFYFFGWRILAMIAVSYMVGGAVEVLFAVVRKEEINEGFLVTGLIFPLVLPPTLPLWMVAVGIVFGVLVGKELFGGTGRNLFNPALVGRCFLALGYPVAMSANWLEPGSGLLGRLFQYVGATDVDALASATPLVMAKQGTFAPLWKLMLGNVPGSVGETSALAILAGGIVLLLSRVGNWRSVVGILGSFAILETIVHFARPDIFGPAVWHLCAGGLLFGAFFMATDPVTSPITNGGKWAYGVAIGVVTVLIRNLTGYVEGAMFAILLGNIVAPVLDTVAIRTRLWRLRSER